MNAKVANWLAGVVLPAALAGGCVLDAVASSRTRAAVEGPVELWRTSGDSVERRPAVPDAREGVPFGHKVRYQLGEETSVDCVGRFARYSCADGWRIAPVDADG